MTPKFTIHANSQKIHGYYHKVITNAILTEICEKITGVCKFEVEFIEDGYNKGRLVYLEHEGWKYYITLSELDINGRNSSLQSVPTALNLYFADPVIRKKIMYYFLPNINGNPYTDYHIAYYRLLLTAGVEFLNLNPAFNITPFLNIDQLITAREINRGANRSNNSSYITRDRGRVQVFAKTYGASKYESTLLGIAASRLSQPLDPNIQLFNIREKDLKSLPQTSIDTLNSLGNIEIYDTNYTLERERFIQTETLSLRSPLYSLNLLERLGHKHCALCDCEIPDIIQGAHIWGVSMIRQSSMSGEDKFAHAISGHNGLWLCSNHHKLFDSHIIKLDERGHVFVREDFSAHHQFISSISPHLSIRENILSKDFINYINMRNAQIPNWAYTALSQCV